MYGASDELIRLEIKEKNRSLTKKSSCIVTKEEYKMILKGDELPPFSDRAPLNLLLMKIKCDHLRPKAIVAYERSAFVYPAGNVRITFDRNICASRHIDSFFKKELIAPVPVLPSGLHVLEVKYDELLPSVIAGQLETGSLRQTAFSKYYLGRLALGGDFPIER
ncbi:MAG: VTC domain-containing protein [Clostridia bacterium]|nr:VTC domain-containing protein [Clostridia bacterium]